MRARPESRLDERHILSEVSRRVMTSGSHSLVRRSRSAYEPSATSRWLARGSRRRPRRLNQRLSRPPAVLDRGAGVHHHRHACGDGASEGVLVDDAELEPHAAGADGDAPGRRTRRPRDDRRNTSTTSTGNGTSARAAYPGSPSTGSASGWQSGWMGTMRLPLRCSSSAMLYAVRRGSRSPITAHVSHSSSIRSTHSCRCQSLTSPTLGWPHERLIEQRLPALRALGGAPGDPRGGARPLRGQGGAVRRGRRRGGPLPAGGGRGPAGRRLPRPARPGGVRRRRRRRAGHGAGDRGDRPGLHGVLADPRGQQAGLDAGDAVGVGGAAEEVPHQARRRRGRLLLLPVRARRRLRRRGDEDPRRARRRRLGARRREAVDHQRRGLGVLHGDGGDRSRDARARASRRSSSRSPTRASRSGRRRRSSASRAARPARSTSTRSGSPPTG